MRANSDTDYDSDLERLLSEARYLGDSHAAIAVLEEAVRIADTHGDIPNGFEARQMLIEAGTFNGRPDLSLVAFTWCLAQCDRDPDQFSESELLWRFKWIVDNLPTFPQITREQIESTVEDMEQRYVRAGSSLHPLHRIRRSIALCMGDLEAAKVANDLQSKVSRSHLSDCPACVADQDIEYHETFNNDELAVATAKDIVAGRLRCREVPHRTYARLLLPLLRLGRLGEAMEFHLKGYRLIQGNPKFIERGASHIEFLTLTDNTAKASQLIGKHFAQALTTPAPCWRFGFMRAVRLFLLRLKNVGQEAVKLRLPPTVPFHNPTGKYAVADLAAWVERETDDLAHQFDTRNGNTYFRDRLLALPSLAETVRPYPIPTRSSKTKTGNS